MGYEDGFREVLTEMRSTLHCGIIPFTGNFSSCINHSFRPAILRLKHLSFVLLATGDVVQVGK
jgi:hypothetical protein